MSVSFLASLTSPDIINITFSTEIVIKTPFTFPTSIHCILHFQAKKKKSRKKFNLPYWIFKSTQKQQQQKTSPAKQRHKKTPQPAWYESFTKIEYGMKKTHT